MLSKYNRREKWILVAVAAFLAAVTAFVFYLSSDNGGTERDGVSADQSLQRLKGYWLQLNPDSTAVYTMTIDGEGNVKTTVPWECTGKAQVVEHNKYWIDMDSSCAYHDFNATLDSSGVMLTLTNDDGSGDPTEMGKQ